MENAPTWSRSFALHSGIAAGAGAAVLVRSTCFCFDIDAADAQLFELCVAEAVNNASEHAYQSADGLPIRLTLRFADGTLTLQIVDSGCPMLPGTLEAARMPEPDPDDPTTWSERGRGLAIQKESMDGVTYETVGAENRLTMWKRVKKTTPREAIDQHAAELAAGKVEGDQRS